MNSIALLLAAMAVIADAAGPATVERVALKNDLSACAKLELRKIETRSNLVTVKVKASIPGSIGRCGCTSGLAVYTSSVYRAGVRQVLQFGLVALMESGERTLVLATDPALISGQSIALRVSCAPPS